LGAQGAGFFASQATGRVGDCATRTMR
jgi:hypothetical protein